MAQRWSASFVGFFDGPSKTEPVCSLVVESAIVDRPGGKFDEPQSESESAAYNRVHHVAGGIFWF